MTYQRTYADRPCIKCGEMITDLKGPQRMCVTCGSHCDVVGCDNKVRAKGKCSFHGRTRHPVVAIVPRNGLCGIDECDRSAVNKGMCQFHYDRVLYYGSAGDAKPTSRHKAGVPCSIEGCGKPARGRGLCMTHYRRATTHGNVGGVSLLRAAQGDGSITETGYRKVKVDEVYVYEHRHVMEQMLGRKLLRGENVHHVDGDKLNNDPDNLERWMIQQPSGQRVSDLIDAAIKLLRDNSEEAALHGVRLVNLESQEASDFYSKNNVSISAGLMAALGQGA